MIKMHIHSQHNGLAVLTMDQGDKKQLLSELELAVVMIDDVVNDPEEALTEFLGDFMLDIDNGIEKDTDSCKVSLLRLVIVAKLIKMMAEKDPSDGFAYQFHDDVLRMCHRYEVSVTAHDSISDTIRMVDYDYAYMDRICIDWFGRLDTLILSQEEKAYSMLASLFMATHPLYGLKIRSTFEDGWVIT